MRRTFVYAALVFALAASSCSVIGGGDPEPTAPPGGVLMRFDGGTIAAEVVADDSSRQLGLMHRRRLGTDAGMLFLFAAPESSPFWMWNTLVPLSIAYLRWVDKAFEVVDLKHMTPCRRSKQQCGDASRNYSPGTSYDAALEVNRGWFKRHGVSIGDAAQAEGALPTPS